MSRARWNGGCSLNVDPMRRPIIALLLATLLLDGAALARPSAAPRNPLITDNVPDPAVLRVVVREGFSADLARALKDDIVTVLGQLDELKPRGQFDELQPFAH